MIRLKNFTPFRSSLFNKKIIFKKNKNRKILILDDTYLKYNLGHSIEKINYNELNLYYFFEIFYIYIKNLKKYSLKEVYKKVLYESYNPKIAVGNNLSLKIFECKNLCPKIKTITYQFSWINGLGSGGFNPNNKSLKKYNKTDYFLILHEHEKKILKKFYNTKFIVVGFIRNNQILLKQSKKIYMITYISDYEKQPAPIAEKIDCEKFILQLLNDYCKKKKKKLVIALKSNRIDKKVDRQKEINYYENLLGESFIQSTVNSYKVINRSKLAVTLSSSLGLEMLSRGSRILFLPYLSKFSKKLICFYTPKKNNSDFIHNNFNKNIITKKIDKLISLKKNNWDKILNKFNKKIIFDKNNKILIGLCNLIIKNG